MAHKFTDEELVSHYLETQQNDYFDQLYRRYCHKVHRKCLSFTKDDVQAQDLTQDIFLRLMTKLTSYKQQSRFSTWLYSITHNYCTNQIRSPHKLNELTIDVDWEMLPGNTDDGDAEQHELNVRQVQRAMMCLTYEEQQLLQLKYLDDFSIRELADKHAISESAVKMRLKRSRDRLRYYYQRQLID